MNKTLTKIMSKKLLVVLFVLMVALIGTAFYQKKPWVAPASADAKKSPLHNEAVQIAEGKKIYEKHVDHHDTFNSAVEADQCTV